MPPRKKRGRKPLAKRRRRKPKRHQAGGQLGALASILGPIVAKEIGKVVIPKLVGVFKKKKKGKGLGLAGSGLRLAGQRGGRRHLMKPGMRRARKRPAVVRLQIV